MTTLRLSDRNPLRIPKITRYISLAILICLALIVADRMSQRSNARVTTSPNIKAMPGTWYKFISPDGDFSLAFPRQPILEDVSQGPTTIIRTFSTTLENGMTFSINFHDVGGDPRARANNEWGQDHEAVVSAADRESGLRVVQIHRLAKNVVEVELWQTLSEPADTNINYLRRSILRQGRVYTLACGWVINGKRVDKPTCARFFNSMHFINRPKSRQPK